jgi:RimJ/RimL family protein N-acetyltransferase
MIAAGRIAKEGLRTERLTFAPLTAAHADVLFPLLDDWDVVRMLAVVPWPLSVRDVEDYAARSVRRGAESDDFVVVSAGEPIGVGTVKKPGIGNPPRKMPRLGYWIGRPHWGRGLGTATVGALVDRAFRNYPGERIGAGVFVDNHASRRVLEKFGFSETGRYMVSCRARGADVETIDMQLSRAAWETRSGRR